MEEIRKLGERKKKLKEKLKEVELKQRELIKKAKEERILSDTFLKFYPALYYWVIFLESSLRLAGLEAEPHKYTPKALATAVLLYKCNRGKAVNNIRKCFERLAKELLEAESILRYELNASFDLSLRNYLWFLRWKISLDFQALHNELKGKTAKEKIEFLLKLTKEEIEKAKGEIEKEKREKS